MIKTLKIRSIVMPGTVAAAFLLCLSSLSAPAAATASTPYMPKSPANTDYESVTSDIYPEAPKKNAVETARKFVRMTGVSRNLSLLLLDEVKTDPLVQAAIQRHGMAKVQAKVVNAIRSAQNAYSGEWSEMLAGVYLRHIDEDAMKSILSMREASPFFMQLIDEQDSIAAEVKAKGGAIFAEARARVQERLKAEF